jgi:hypothetical protein
VTEDVNKAGTGYHTSRVYYLSGYLSRNASGWNDFYDAISLDGDIAMKPGIAGSVHYLCPADQDINGVYGHV